MIRHIKLPNLPSGVLPYNTTTLSIQLGTTIRWYSITSLDSNSALAQIASDAATLSDAIETVTSQDFQPDAGSTVTAVLSTLFGIYCAIATAYTIRKDPPPAPSASSTSSSAAGKHSYQPTATTPPPLVSQLSYTSQGQYYGGKQQQQYGYGYQQAP
ncbi:hypothetical protein JCM8547_004116 [Rhodosporidiobolus lusitaniae]